MSREGTLLKVGVALMALAVVLVIAAVVVSVLVGGAPLQAQLSVTNA